MLEGELEELSYTQNASQFQLFGNGTPAEMVNVRA